MTKYNVDPDRPIETILSEIKGGAEKTAEHTRFIGGAVAPFAALLVKLANSAEASTERLERLTKRLYWATVALLIVTAGLFLKEIASPLMDFYEKHYALEKHNPDADKNKKITNPINPIPDVQIAVPPK